MTLNDVYINIETASREQWERAVAAHRDDVCELLHQLAIDNAEWHRRHPEDAPVVVVYDFREDVAEAMAGGQPPRRLTVESVNE
jgi:hypothetical protein